MCERFVNAQGACVHRMCHTPFINVLMLFYGQFSSFFEISIRVVFKQFLSGEHFLLRNCGVKMFFIVFF